MTAIIKIKGKDEVIRVNDEDGELIKAKKADVNVPRSLWVDLGSWAGELGDIKSIDIEPDVVGGDMARVEREEKVALELIEAFKKLTPEEKLAQKYEEVIGYFKVKYKFTNEGKEASEELVKRVEGRVVEHFAANPEALGVPQETFADLLTQ